VRRKGVAVDKFKLRFKNPPNSEVGYGKPPWETQFKKGVSGNPRGRPKGSVNLASAVEKTLREKVTVTENGRRRGITKFEAVVKQLVNKAASGESSWIKLLLELVRIVEDRFGATTATARDLPEADRKVMNRILGRLKNITHGDEYEIPHT
jgi:hypothetical protein